MPFDLAIIQSAVEHRFTNIDEIGFEPDEDRLSFGVAEAVVVFEEFGAVGGHHEAEEEDAAIAKAFADTAMECWADDLVCDRRQLVACEQRGVGERAHAAGVRAGVAIANAFMIAD